MNTQDPIQFLEALVIILAIILSVIGIGFWIAWARFNEKRWRYTVAPLTWLIHSALYFVCRLIGPVWMTTEVRTTWKLAIILQGIISLAFGGMVMWQLTQRKLQRVSCARQIIETLLIGKNKESK